MSGVAWGLLAVCALQRLQAVLPLSPAGMAAVSPDSAFNTAISFAATTNWQGYSGEATMCDLTRMLGLAVQNFLSAATGVIGNFWVDVTGITAWLLVPLSLVFALLLAGSGVIQNFDAYKVVNTLETTCYQQAKTGPHGQPLKDAQGAVAMEVATTGTQTPRGPLLAWGGRALRRL